MFKHSKLLTTLSYLYLYIPLCIFLFAWVNPLISVPVILFSFYCLVLCIRDNPEIPFDLFKNRKKLFTVIGIICIWVFLSGIGGFIWQNIDHLHRNAIYRDLFYHDWPVVNYGGDVPESLCYYFGFWLPSALVAKIFNNIHAGYIFQYIWGTFGVVLAFFLISTWLKKFSYKALLIFIFFSGWDIIAFYCSTNTRLEHLFFDNFFTDITQHIEWKTWPFQSSSNTSLLFFVYNQIISFWIGFMLILLQKNKKYIFFTYSLLLLFSPIPSVGLVPVILFLELKDIFTVKPFRWNQFITQYLTLSNICGLIVLLVIGLFYKTNISANKPMLLVPSPKILVNFFMYLAFEYGVFIVFIYKKVKRDYLFHIFIVTMMLFSFIHLGHWGVDFAMRTCIPTAFYLMLNVMKEVEFSLDLKQLKYKLLILTLFIGSITTWTELLRPINETRKVLTENEGKSLRNNDLKSVFIDESDPFYEETKLFNVQYKGNEDSFFNKYIRKRTQKP